MSDVSDAGFHGFNPLRGLGPRRTTVKLGRIRKEKFQSAPRLGAAENHIIP